MSTLEIVYNKNDQINTYRWRVVAEDGETLGHSYRGFKSKTDCIDNMARVAAAILHWGNAPITEERPNTKVPPSRNTPNGSNASLRADYYLGTE